MVQGFSDIVVLRRANEVRVHLWTIERPLHHDRSAVATLSIKLVVSLVEDGVLP
jgi:hypothetical protein